MSQEEPECQKVRKCSKNDGSTLQDRGADFSELSVAKPGKIKARIVMTFNPWSKNRYPATTKQVREKRKLLATELR